MNRGERENEREETEKEKLEWDRIKKNFEEKIKVLELKAERKEKEMRRNNIVIKGVEWKEQGTTEEVKRFLNEHLKMETEMVETRRVNKKK